MGGITSPGDERTLAGLRSFWEWLATVPDRLPSLPAGPMGEGMPVRLPPAISAPPLKVKQPSLAAAKPSPDTPKVTPSRKQETPVAPHGATPGPSAAPQASIPGPPPNPEDLGLPTPPQQNVLGSPEVQLSRMTATSPVPPFDMAAKRKELESVYGPEREPDPWKQFSLRLASGFVPPEQRAPFVNEATELRGSAEDYNRRRQQDIQTQLLFGQREQSEQEAAKQALQNQFALLDYQQAALQNDPLRQAQIAEIRSRAASLPLQVQLQVSDLLLQAQRYADVRDDQNADRLRQAATTLVESAVRMGTSPAGMMGTVDPRVMQGGQIGTNYLMSQFPGAAAQAPQAQGPVSQGLEAVNYNKNNTAMSIPDRIAILRRIEAKAKDVPDVLTAAQRAIAELQAQLR